MQRANATTAPDTRLAQIVVVEDDPASADLLERRLRANGLEVSVGRDGAEGMALIRKIRPDLVILDVMLPDTDGYDVCLRLKSDRSTERIPVIFVSARGDVFDKVRALSSGAADYLTKPYEPAELLARIDAVLRHTRAAGAHRPEHAASDELDTPPTVQVLVEDATLRRTIVELLGPRFEMVGEDGAAELLLADGDPVTPPPTAVVLRVKASDAAEGDGLVVDEHLPRIAELAVRERRRARDVDAATEVLVTLARALEGHDRADGGQGERVAARAAAVARTLGVDEEGCRTIRLGALLRDVGKARLPTSLLAAERLDPQQRAAIERHAVLGAELLSGFRPLSRVLRIVRSHHEHLDGSGYPDRLRADQIPLEVRIVTAADRFEALLGNRPDRPAVTPNAALRVLQTAVGEGKLDAAVVAALASLLREGMEGPA